jgi:cobalt-precorrin 5A hydrolase / precorrin-3B C17-methyltransferase
VSPPVTAVVSLTASGAAVARRLPYEHHHGDLAATVRSLWDGVDRLVLVCATGLAVRVIAPLLGDKRTDPAVVAVDDSGRWAVALAGGHAGANALATDVAALLGGEPVVTTATDAAGLAGLDALPGFRAEGDVAAVTRAWLDGSPPSLDRSDLPGWPVPAPLAGLVGRNGGPTRLRITDRRVTGAPPPTPTPDCGPGGADAGGEGKAEDTAGATADADAGAARTACAEVLLRPPSLVVGVGSSSGADPRGIAQLVDGALAGAGLSAAAVGLVATVERKAREPGIVVLAARLGVELRALPAERLAAVDVPNPSTAVAEAVGTPSVCEAAALLAAGPGADLVVTKQRSAEATVAVARRARPTGHLAVVGLGPGDPALRTPAAATAVRHAEVVVGYAGYVDQASDLLRAHHEVVRSPIGAEADRCAEALDRAAAGQRVALVCSGDPGVYAMAPLVHELARSHGGPPVTVIPGVTAALASAAILGAPLGHDHAAVSLSDLLTPWTTIERRLLAVAEGDFVVSLYNPRSLRRTTQLVRALDIFSAHRPPTCPVAVVTDACRPTERVVRTTLAELDPGLAGMQSLVVVGATTTRWIGERMVTPRGYTA